LDTLKETNMNFQADIKSLMLSKLYDRNRYDDVIMLESGQDSKARIWLEQLSLINNMYMS